MVHPTKPSKAMRGGVCRAGRLRYLTLGHIATGPPA